MFAVDLHAHSRFFHAFEGRSTPFDAVGARLLARFARRRGLDAVAVTNHDYRYRAPATMGSVRLIPGIEVSTTDGHVLVVGPDPPARTRPGVLTPQEVVTMAHERDCAAIIPHPYRHSTVRESLASFDAVEVNGKHPQMNTQVRALAENRDLPVVGGSDAHYPFEAGRAYTRVDAADRSPESIVSAIREGKVDAELNGSLADRLLQRGYNYVHRYKGHVTP